MDYKKTFTDDQLNCLKDSLGDETAIRAYIEGIIDGEINRSKKKLIKAWWPKLFADPDVENIPGNESDFLTTVFARSDYKDRAARDAEGKAAAE